jgi:hypothetical protein
MSLNFAFACRRRGRIVSFALSVFFAAMLSPVSAANLIDVWRAEDLNLNDGDAVTTWTSTGARAANPVAGTGQPVLKLGVTPAGGKAVRFNGNRMAIGSSTVGGRTAFSLVYVFKADAVGANGNVQWYGKSGIVDAEQGGVTADWGTVITETGNVGLGIGAGDTSLYSSGASLVDGAYHVAAFTWGGGAQSVYVDSRAPVSVASATAARNNVGFSFGGINTDEGGATRRLVGDLVEIRFYDTALTSIEASNVIDELRTTHIFGTLPRIFSFTSTTNQIFLGQSVTLAWAVSNATSVVIDNGVGSVAASNNIVVAPTLTTTYTLTATNTNGLRSAMVTVIVDPGIPTAFNFSTNTPYNTPVAITLRGFDPQGSNLTYSIVNPPAHGSLSGTPPNVSYQPVTNYGGLDSFTFKVNDGMFDSAPATVSLNVVPPPLPPTGVVLSSTNISSEAGPGAFIAALQAVDVNNLYGDSHTFALAAGFGQNSQFAITGNVLSAGPSFAGGPGATFNLRIITTDSTSFSYTQDVSLVVVDVVRTVVINEIHYNGSANVVRDEFIELYNPSGAVIDISQWRVRGGVDFFFPPNTFLAPGGFVVVAEDPATISNRYGITAFGPWTGGLNNEGEELTLRDTLNDVIDRVDFKSEFPWPIAANGGGASMQLVNPSLDNDLGSSWRSGAPPTPGATNSVFSTNAAPNIRQVDHQPNTPVSTNQVTVTAKVTDPQGVASVTLAYQVIAPGNYIPATLPLTTAQLNTLNANPTLTNALNSAFENPANWTSVAMHDDGLNGDAVAGDSIYSAIIPQQANRTLVRYRITCTDALGLSRRAPFEDDESLNFAYFVYDGIPNYLTHSSTNLQTLEVYSLITRDADVNQCAAWFNGGDQLVQDIGGQRNEGRLNFNWEGALVYDGKVFDHVHYRLRGANGRYHAGKRSFRIRFNDGALLEPRDQSGKKMPTKWRELTTGKGQSNRGGEQFALNEVVNFFLWNKVGVPAPRTFHFHFRVIRGASEAGADQYSGDFWGLNWAQEKYDVNFLDGHDMPKGNLYKLVDNYVLGADERRYQAAFAVTNAEDFFNMENNLTGFQSIDWLNAHANYTNWYRYFTIVEAIRHYDTWPSANKNGAWYFEPLYGASNSNFGRMMQLPYDSTDTWGATWNNGEDILFNGIFPSSATGGDAGQHPEMQLEYRNTVREIRTLLFQPDQINPVIDAHARPLIPVAAADSDRWRAAPSPASYNSLIIPTSPGVTGGLTNYAQDMKNFMFVGGNNAWWIDRNSIGAGGWVTRLDTIATDPSIPNRPTIAYVGTNGFPIDGLTFQSSAFSDPDGAGTFGAIQWRIAEVLATNTAVSNVAQLRLEWDAAWLSPEITAFNSSNTFPEFAVQAGQRYRARVRHKDTTGRWSAWSLPVEFVPSPRDTVSALRTNLVFNEIHYNPPTYGPYDGDELEFLELKNIGAFSLNLSGLLFSQGITFTFTNGTVLAPGAVFLLARNSAAMALRYPGVVVNGLYTGKLNNDGETLAIVHPSAGEIISITYGDRAPWPVTANGFGFSITRAASGEYRASAAPLGTPGVDGGASAIGGIVINEILANSTLPAKDLIELVNIATTNVDISGWYLTDDPKLPQKFRIPNRPPLAPGEFVVFTEDDFNPTPGFGTSFSLSSMGDDAYVFSADSGAQLTGYSYGLEFGASADGETLGRYINSVGEVQLPAQLVPTPGSPNAGPRVGPLVLNEIMYNPETGRDEFVEVRNITTNAVPLFDALVPTNTWRVNGIGFSFPTNFTLGPNELVLIVPIHPGVFRAKYGVPTNVTVLGPYFGNLQDSGERLELQRPGVQVGTNGVPYITIDEVRYNDKTPWPEAADGHGPSLQRLVPADYGNDPTNWVAAIPTLGADYVVGTAPGITLQPTNRIAAIGGSTTFTVGFTGAPPLQVRWRVGGTNILNATNATLVLSNLQPSFASNYSAVVFNSGGSVISSNATLTLLSPVAFTIQPTNQNVLPGTNVTLTALAVGNGAVRYQWRFEGTNILNATNASYSFTGANLTSHHGNFSVVASDEISEAISPDAFIYVLVKPGIVTHIASQTVLQGANATFSLVATGAPPLGYRWIRGGGSLPGATTSVPVLVITNVQASSTIRVAVTNVALPNSGVGAFSPGPAAGNNVNLTVLADADGDGMWDVWETNYFGNTFGTNFALVLPGADPDGDGMNNRDEYIAGTNPTNALSVLNIVLTATNANVLQFVAQTNVSYSVQSRSNLAAAAWINLTNITASSLVRTIQVDTVTAPLGVERYFRVVTPLVP